MTQKKALDLLYDQRVCFRADEVAAMTGVSIQMIYKEVKYGSIKAIRRGKMILIMKQEFEDWISPDRITEPHFREPHCPTLRK